MASSASVSLVLLIFAWSSLSCHGFQTFSFDIHHRFSDPVKGILTVDELPTMGSVDYYAAMAHRDQIIRGRGLSGDIAQSLTFSNGNDTYRIASLGFLHYANVSLGTPSLSFLVALDTGSDLFWVPCDCRSCVKALVTKTGAEFDLNIYSTNASSTGKNVPCNSSFCEHKNRCSGTPSKCPYEVRYLSNDTSSYGILVEDVLHLKTEDNHSKVVEAPITFGCGQVQTGSFLSGAAPNGLFGLGMDKSSVPSILSAAGLVADSFSMCFGPDGVGRISFGEKGGPDMEKTPFNANQLQPTYNITVIQVIVETNITDTDFNAIFDSGTSFTYLNDPAYSDLSESFNLQAKDKRRPPDSRIPFEYCYNASSNDSSTLFIPNVTLTMKGGSQFPVFHPLVLFYDEIGLSAYCLGIVKSPDINIIGQNFMTGQRIVFNREEQVLSWQQSNCYNIEDSSTLPVKPPTSTVVPPATAVEPPVHPVKPGNYAPEATKETGGSSHASGIPPASTGESSQLKPIGYTFLMLFVPILAMI